MPDTSHLVIIGGGMTAHRLVEALRARDGEGAWRITVFAEEPRRPYDRVALTSYFSKRDPEELALGEESLWADDLVTLRTGTPIEHIDMEAKTVTDDLGRVTAYDELLRRRQPDPTPASAEAHHHTQTGTP